MKKKNTISKTIHNWLFVCVLTAFSVATLISFVMNTRMSRANTEKLLHTHLEDVCSSVQETDSLTILNNTLYWADYFNNFDSFEPSDDFMRMLNNIAWGNDIDEICIIDENGIIISSNVREYLGYEMARSEQSAEFMVLLNDTTVKTYVQELRTQGYDEARRFRYAASVFADHPGFLELGISEANYTKRIKQLLNGSTRYRRIGDHGSIYILDQDFDLISAPYDCTLMNADSIGITRQLLDEQKPQHIFECDILGEPCYCMYSYEQHSIVLAAQPVSEATLTRNMAVTLSSLTVSIIFLILFIAIWLLLRKLVVNNIDKVNDSLTKITNGNLEEKVEVRGTSEFDSLSTDINMTVNRLKDYIHEAETRIDADLALSKAIQLSSLPSTFPAFPNRNEFDIYASMNAAKEVGGDFYDFYFSGKDKITITIADVAGKGIPAAMFMMRGKSTLKNQINTGIALADACNRVNANLCTNNDTNTFFTAWIGQIDLSTGWLTYVNCGHNLPVIRHNGGVFDFANCKANLAMAIFDDFTYESQTVQLQPGDEIFLYTDGVTEAENTTKELFGDQQLIDSLNAMPVSKAGTPESICKYVLHCVQTFANGAEQSDDITMLCFKYLGK